MMKLEDSITSKKENISRLAWFIASCVGILVAVFLCIFISDLYWVDIKHEHNVLFWITPFGLSVVDKSWQHIFLRYLLSLISGGIVGLCLGISQWLVLRKRNLGASSFLKATILSAIIASLLSTTYQIAGDFRIEIFRILCMFLFLIRFLPSPLVLQE